MRLTDPTLSQRIKIQVQLIGATQDAAAEQAILHHQVLYRVQDHALDLKLPNSTGDALLMFHDKNHGPAIVNIPRMITNYEKAFPQQIPDVHTTAPPRITRASDGTVATVFQRPGSEGQSSFRQSSFRRISKYAQPKAPIPPPVQPTGFKPKEPRPRPRTPWKPEFREFFPGDSSGTDKGEKEEKSSDRTINFMAQNDSTSEEDSSTEYSEETSEEDHIADISAIAMVNPAGEDSDEDELQPEMQRMMVALRKETDDEDEYRPIHTVTAILPQKWIIQEEMGHLGSIGLKQIDKHQDLISISRSLDSFQQKVHYNQSRGLHYKPHLKRKCWLTALPRSDNLDKSLRKRSPR
ncbi:hypothetical protein PIB30_052402 [Stylosanthes scabra]|uniref:Uncharacterized protein n=1 Tax=Stylosanthes scabra TaxID=79078 RepID=A0ABU6YIN0_9FABA|nr:hypothetical protein [Stylosanthes scabra]